MLVDACVADGRVADAIRLDETIRESWPEDTMSLGPHAWLPHFRTDAVRGLVVALGIAEAPIAGGRPGDRRRPWGRAQDDPPDRRLPARHRELPPDGGGVRPGAGAGRRRGGPAGGAVAGRGARAAGPPRAGARGPAAGAGRHARRDRCPPARGHPRGRGTDARAAGRRRPSRGGRGGPGGRYAVLPRAVATARTGLRPTGDRCRARRAAGSADPPGTGRDGPERFLRLRGPDRGRRGRIC